MKKSDILKNPSIQEFITAFAPQTPRRAEEFQRNLMQVIWEICLLVDEEAMRHRRAPAAVELG
jgi:hypothetical protein